MGTAFPETLFLGETYIVYGLGNSGTHTVKALLSMGATVFAWDDSENFKPKEWEEALSGSEFSQLFLSPITAFPSNAKALILSPGVPHTYPSPHPIALLANKNNIPIISDVELFYQAVRKSGSKAHFIGITGTNGKSTCTALTAHLLSQENKEVIAGGNIGKSVFALPLFGDTGIYVIEMSSYMLERLQSFQPDVAAWTTFSPDHLDRHYDLQGYLKAKRNIFNNLTPSGLAVFGEKEAWSLDEVSLLQDRSIRCEFAQAFPASKMPLAPHLPGQHNYHNLALCLFIAKFFGISDEAIANGVQSFRNLPHRLQMIGHVGKISFVNDSKATNFEAALPALTAWDDIFWIMGGIAKANGIEGIEKVASHIQHAFVIGKDAARLSKTLAKAKIPYSLCNSLEDATKAAYAQAKEAGKGVVLLSPACASQDQFRNFEERGHAFAACCANIASKSESTQKDNV
ncbi:UDP-N-acetylmuramoyl-L-alanine--D-glutamate ligase [Acetobacteraceae bacterium]|nr:UDP-N-acetylmuramoyl-L-alanine--D-glutamate ligase [Acetobacteraceae bacterium]